VSWKIWQAPVDEPEKIERRRQELKTRKARQGHEISLAELDDERIEVRSERQERRADRREERALAKLSRQASVSGARVRVAHDLYDSGEIRALRIRRIRKVSLSTLLPVLIAFAAWSTIGVHAGTVKLLGVGPGDPMWTGAWFVEPAIATIVGGIIVVRAALRSAGGDLDWRATVIEWGMLSASVALNLAGSWPDGGLLEGAAATIAHSIGPVGVMVTAVLISIVDDAVAKAKPFAGRKSYADPVVAVEVSQVFPSQSVPDERPEIVPVSQIERPKVSRRSVPDSVPPVVPEASQWDGDIVPAGRPEDSSLSHRGVPDERPMSRPEQFEKVVAAYEAQRDAGQSSSVRTVAELTGVSKTTVGRILKPYTDKAKAV
jgi:hypothetical protein